MEHEITKYKVVWEHGKVEFETMKDAMDFVDRNGLSNNDTEVWKRVYYTDENGDYTDMTDLDDDD